MHQPHRAVAMSAAAIWVLAATGTTPAQTRPRGTARAGQKPVPPPPPLTPVELIVPVPPPPPPEPLATVAQLQVTLQLMRDKGLITETEYQEALAGRAVAVAAPTKPVVTPKWETSLYGFIEADAILDSTQSLTEVAGNSNIARNDTFVGSNGRFQYSVRNTRLGYRVRAPEFFRINASALVEMDFLGNQATTASELVTYTGGLVRLRHLNLLIETPYLDLLIGQSWQLFGWQPYFQPSTVSIQGAPGEVYSRGAQLRLSHRFTTSPVSVDVAVAMARAPQRDSMNPDGQAGVRVVFNRLRGLRTIGATATTVDSAAIGVSGTVRRFSLPEFSANPQSSVGVTGWGISIDALLPVVPVPDRRSWAFTVHGSFVRGSGIADYYTGLTGGVNFPTLPLGGMYNANIDKGLAMFDKNGNLGTVDWQSFLIGAQLYLPPQGRIFLTSNFSQMNSDNAANYGEATQVFTQSRMVSVSTFLDATAALRFGIEYMWMEQTYVDGAAAQNHRGWFTALFLF